MQELIKQFGGKGAHLEWLQEYQVDFKVPGYSLIDTHIFDEVSSMTRVSREFENFTKFKSAVMAGESPEFLSGRFPEWFTRDFRIYFEMSLDQRKNNRKKILETGLRNGVIDESLRNIYGSQNNLETLRNFLEPKFSNFIGTPFVVRSSATCEDGGEYSFAGFFETVLPPESVDLNNERWFTLERGIDSYLHILTHFLGVTSSMEYGPLSFDDKCGVIVQEYIPSEVSGVMYTSLTEEPATMAMSLVNGRCSRAVNGDEDEGICINKESREIERFGNPTVSEKQIDELFKIGSELERTYNSPLDIEFGFSGGELYLFQARPTVKTRQTSFEAPKNAKELARIPVNLSSGGFVGKLVKYFPRVKSHDDLSVGGPYILVTDEAGNNYWNVTDLPENCGGIIITNNKLLGRCSHDANIFRQSDKVITSTQYFPDNIDFESKGCFDISSKEFVLVTKGRGAILYSLG